MGRRWADRYGRAVTIRVFVILRVNEGGKEQVLVYIPTLIDCESDNLIERHRGHL